jgi:hypothetical protein
MSSPPNSQPDPAEPGTEAEVVLDEETVEGVAVLSDVRAIEPAPSSALPVLPAVQAAAVAATGFVAGAATLALMRRHATRKLARSGLRRGVDALPIAGTRSFLIDIHLIAKPGE